MQRQYAPKCRQMRTFNTSNSFIIISLQAKTRVPRVLGQNYSSQNHAGRPESRTSKAPHRISASKPLKRTQKNRNGEALMTGEAGKQAEFIASTLAFGILGAGLVYYGRRAEPGILATVASTVGYGLVTKAVSTAVFAALAPTGS